MAVEGQRTGLADAGAKYDGEKIQWDLLPFDALEEVARVYTLGAKKYAPRNWEKGISYMRIVGALLRHLMARVMGETYDAENGQRHSASVVWNALTLLAYELRTMDGGAFDDRPRAQFYDGGKEAPAAKRSGPETGGSTSGVEGAFIQRAGPGSLDWCSTATPDGIGLAQSGGDAVRAGGR
jgi:hypothetical protein